MAINPTGAAPVTLPDPAQRNDAARTARENANAGEARVSGREAVQQETNVRILQASLTVSIRAGDDSQALLFRSAIENINGALEGTLGPNAIQNAATSGDDFSPEAVAGRILALSTGFFDAFAAQRPDADPDEVAREFADLIRGGFEQGFNEAREILQGLNVFSGEVESNAMRTAELFMEGLDAFLADRLQRENAEDTAAPGGEPGRE